MQPSINIDNATKYNNNNQMIRGLKYLAKKNPILDCLIEMVILQTKIEVICILIPKLVTMILQATSMGKMLKYKR